MLFYFHMDAGVIGLIAIVSLVIWAAFSIWFYLTSPFALYKYYRFYSTSYTHTRAYRIYQELIPGDRRSRAILCIIYPIPNVLALTLVILVFYGIILGAFKDDTALIASIVVLIGTMSVAVVVVNYLLAKLVRAGVIKLNDSTAIL